MVTHEEYVEFENKYGEPPELCSWCKRFKRRRDIRNFLGIKVCSACYKRFKNLVETPNVERTIKYILSISNAHAEIKKDDKSIRIKIQLTS